MRIVQLSDLHLRPQALYSGIDPWSALAGALSRARSFAPDLLLLSGDLADDGEAATYRRLLEALEENGLPYAVLPGNHDQRQPLRDVFSRQAWSHPELASQRADLGNISLLLLDSVIPGEEGGEVRQQHIDWLESHCPSGRRVALVLHHPPFRIGIEGMDAIACQGGELLAAWLATKPQVERVLCGHVHRHVTTDFAGRLALTAPSTVHQIALQDGPLAYTPEAGGLLVHDVLPGEPWRTHYLPLAAEPVIVYPE